MGKYAALAAGLLLTSLLFADTLTLRDGTVVRGHFVSGTPQKIIFQDHNGVWRRFDVKQVRGIDFGTGTPAPAEQGGGGGSSDRAGSFIAARAEESIDPQNAVAGRTFLATIVEDIHGENGTVIIPGGSPARMMLRPVSGGGGPGYQVQLESVVIDGSRYVVYGDAVAVSWEPADDNQMDKDATTPPVTVIGASIRVPAETVLEFRLDQPLLLRQAAD